VELDCGSIKRWFDKSFMKIYGREGCVQISSHTDSRTRRRNGDSHLAKISSILVKIIPIFLIAFSLSQGQNCPQRKRFQDAEDKINVMVELNAVPLDAFAECFQKFFKRFNKCIKVGGDYCE
jgi:hypothetical protein